MPETTAKNSRLTTIDFLRGIAALAVVIHHAFGSPLWFAPATIDPATLLGSLVSLFPAFGFSGVYLFFVISGFCIHLRWVKAREAGDEKPLEFIPFWKRRIVRLYPAYIVALGVYIGFEVYTGKLHFTSFFFYDLFSHLFMLHNLDSRTVFSFNKVFWTLAVEEQLYLAYFALIWLREKYGWVITLLVTLAMRVIWFAATFLIIKLAGIPLPITESAIATWCVWSLGAVSIEAKFGMINLPGWMKSLPVGMFALVFTMIVCIVGWASPSSASGRFVLFVTQPLFGISFFILLNYVVSLESKIKDWYGAIIRFFAWIGLFSYSLYLTHELIVTYLGISPWFQVVVSCVLAWAFYHLFEKPFMNVARKPIKGGT